MNAAGGTKLKLGGTEKGSKKKSEKNLLEIQNDFQIEFPFTAHVDDKKAIFFSRQPLLRYFNIALNLKLRHSLRILKSKLCSLQVLTCQYPSKVARLSPSFHPPSWTVIVVPRLCWAPMFSCGRRRSASQNDLRSLYRH